MPDLWFKDGNLELATLFLIEKIMIGNLQETFFMT